MTTPKDFMTPDPKLAIGTTHQGFTVTSIEPLIEIDGTAYVMRHDASGARLMWLACADTNRSFAIAFKTPPANHTGVFHILEHSVLCGSDRFPVKEPFVTLLKTSMQTFLNALTFPDKTMYPFSSTNIADYENLMDVYLDAVLHPAIYSRPRIFEQEGWHYEYEDGKLVYNGVVYNEMRGALSDPESVLLNRLASALYPDTAYNWVSGGDPRYIPELTYEEFIDTHARHYNLPNSYTVLYGDLDIERELAFIAERFAGVSTRDVGAPNELATQSPVCPEPIACEMVTTPDNACVGLAYVIADTPDRLQLLAVDLLTDVLAGSNEAPLKRRVLEEGLGDDLNVQVFDGIMQPMLMLTLRGAKEGAAERFRELVEEVVREFVDGGIPKERIEAALAQMEFNLREGDWGWIDSDGIAYSINLLSSWLYDDDRTVDFIRYEDDLAKLKAGVNEGLFERILAEAVLENRHNALVDLVPVEQGNEYDESAKLEGILAGMTEDDLEAIEREVAALRAEQEAPDTPETLATLPRLHLSDLGDAAPEPKIVREENDGIPTLVHDLETHGILYAYIYFDLAHLTFDDYRYVPLLSDLLGNLDTKAHTALELDTLVEANLGRLTFFAENHRPEKESDAVRPVYVIGASVLADKIALMPGIVSEICTSTLFSDTSRVRDLLTQRRLGLEQVFINSGNSAAISRVASYYLRSALANEQLSGVDHYLFLKDMLNRWDECGEEVCARLTGLCQRIFRAEAATVSLTGPDELRRGFWEAGGVSWLGHASAEEMAPRFEMPEPTFKNEAFCTPANVCFVAMGSPKTDSDMGTRGSWQVASRLFTYDYLWNEVRVKGGAYGCGFRRLPSGQRLFWSFRDPNTSATLERFRNAASWLASWEPDGLELEGYIVSTVAGHDAPVKPRALARRQDSAVFAGQDEDWRERLREQVLATTEEDLHALVPALEEAANNHGVCIFGSRDLIEQGKLDLELIDLM